MKLSLLTDYALRTLMFLAANDGHHSIADISVKYGISKNHMMKVAHRLVAEGYVTSVRGRNGGLFLHQPATKINVGQVVRKFEDFGTFVECFDSASNSCVVNTVCGLRHVLTEGINTFLAHLDKYTVADLIGDRDNFNSAWNKPSSYTY